MLYLRYNLPNIEANNTLRKVFFTPQNLNVCLVQISCLQYFQHVVCINKMQVKEAHLQIFNEAITHSNAIALVTCESTETYMQV